MAMIIRNLTGLSIVIYIYKHMNTNQGFYVKVCYVLSVHLTYIIHVKF